MKLIVLYGPPGVGKLTVAEELQRITDFKILHNHLVADLCATVFDFGTAARAELNLRIRMNLFEMAAKNDTRGIITTSSYYAGPQAERAKHYVRNCVRLMKELEGEAYFVKLTCDLVELERRIGQPSRAGTRKITDVTKLRKVLQEELPDAEIPPDITESLRIDNTNLKPEDAASVIKTHYRL